MATKTKLYGFLLLFIFVLIHQAHANIESDWPKTGFVTYRVPSSSGDNVIIRDNNNELYAVMKLYPSQTDYKTPANVDSSFIFDYFGSYRRSYIDVNKNAIANGFGEDFDLCNVGDDPTSNENIKWAVYGGILAHTQIDGNENNKWLLINFENAINTTTAFLFGMIQKDTNKFKHPLDLSNQNISFDISTSGFSTPIPASMSPAVTAYTTESSDYDKWRLQDFSGQVYNNTTATPLLDTPVGTWQTISVNINNLIFHEGEQHWKTADFADSNKFDILFLRVPNAYGQKPIIPAEGSVMIDNLKVGEDCEISKTIPMDVELSLENTYSGSTVNSLFYPLQEVTAKIKVANTGVPFNGEVSIVVYDNTFSWPNKTTGLIYDSNAQGGNQTGYVSYGDSNYFSLKFKLPMSAAAGTYKILASIKNTDTSSAIDTTGPDKSFNDLTPLAYINGFEVGTGAQGDGPVANFITNPETLPISETGQVSGAFDASSSYHITAPYYEIVSYEWDIDNDGVYDISSTQPITNLNYTFPNITLPLEDVIFYPITLRTTDNDDPQKTDTITKTITFGPEIDLYVTNVTLTKDLTGESMNSSDTVFAGTTLRLDITVTNDNGQDWEGQVQVIASKITAPPYDFEFPWLDPINIPQGESRTFTTSFSLPQTAEGNSIETYFYMIRTRAVLPSAPVITHTRNWTQLCNIARLPASKTRDNNFSFCGYDFVKLTWGWNGGILRDNVAFNESGNLLLTMKDYSGVGAQAESSDWTYQYGTYRAYLKVTPTQTTYPKGGVLGFFYYGRNEDQTEIHEIDIELRTMDIDGNGGTSHVLFSVHNELNGDLRTVTHKCPVDDISVYHLYEFRWAPDEIAFFIDGEVAQNIEGQPAFVNNSSVDQEDESFSGKIPSFPGRLIMNFWCGSGFAGYPPQGQGDFTGTIQKISYTPFPEAIIDNFYEDNEGTVNLDIATYRNNNYSLKYKNGELDNDTIPFIEMKSLNGEYNYSYKDNDSDSSELTERFYKITTPEYVE